jgi:carnitine 3-dehydrogenase
MSESGRVHEPGAPQPSDLAGVRRVAVVGCGLIGARWAAQFLAAGLDVTATDVLPGAEERLAATIGAAWPALVRLGRTQAGVPAAPAFTAGLEEAVTGVDFVQENVPDDERLKLEVIGRIDAVADPRAVIASSTSGILPTFLQSGCRHPERVLVGHPFNPVHILPLVEVVPGRQTSADAIATAMAFYTGLGKRPLHVRTEAPGFVANRLQEALIREFFHLVNDGICTTAELDQAMTDGPGLRLALFGPAFVYLLGGGPQGMAGALRQFDPARLDGWSHNVYPPMTEALIAKLDSQTASQAAGRGLEEWEALRDEFLLRLLQLRGELMSQE